ncbi:hypothetical protein EV426DRAFT_669791 [Tirmania nivea]|nr:hypothetical protein EV426DRAFT_669791 [Tirmania nivea]
MLLAITQYTLYAFHHLESKLDDLLVSWAARAVKTGDGDVKNELGIHTKGRTLWHDGTDLPNLNLAGPIYRAFFLTGAEPDELSYGDRDDHRSPPILGLDIIPADSKQSQEKKEWYTELAALKDSGWSLLFTDGTGGKNGEVAAAAVTHVTERGAYLGTLATVADGEEKGITLALGSNAGKLLILTDSMTSKQALLNLGKGAPPRSGIERELKDLLHKRAHLQTAIGWVRSHIGIPGNERADKRAAYESALGRIAGTQQVATAAGIRTAAKARRKDMRSEPGYGSNRCLWHRHALSAYTWLRTNRGPQNYWLHFIRKVDSPACPNCDHPSEDGYHITFDCPHHHQQRQEFIGDARTWEDLDTPIWRKEEGEEEWDAVEAYFAYLYRPLAGR